MPMDFVAHLLGQPLWVQLWVAWMGIINMAAIAFWPRREALTVLIVFAANVAFMNLLFAIGGFNRLLGLSHVLWWTPLVVYLVRRLPAISASTGFGRWVRVLIATNALSLVIDYTDVVRYLLGDR